MVQVVQIQVVTLVAAEVAVERSSLEQALEETGAEALEADLEEITEQPTLEVVEEQVWLEETLVVLLVVLEL